MSRGRGVGGALATVRLAFAPRDNTTRESDGMEVKDLYTLAVRPAVEDLVKVDLVTAAHAGLTAEVARRPLSKESLSLRPNATSFNGVLLIEAISRDAIMESLPRINSILAAAFEKFARMETDIYELAYLIKSAEE
jgi:hypothetical protein